MTISKLPPFLCALAVGASCLTVRADDNPAQAAARAALANQLFGTSSPAVTNAPATATNTLSAAELKARQKAEKKLAEQQAKAAAEQARADKAAAEARAKQEAADLKATQDAEKKLAAQQAAQAAAQAKAEKAAAVQVKTVGQRGAQFITLGFQFEFERALFRGCRGSFHWATPWSALAPCRMAAIILG